MMNIQKRQFKPSGFLFYRCFNVVKLKYESKGGKKVRDEFT